MTRPDWDSVWLSMAVLIGQRSRCAVKVGAVVTGPGNRYVQPGYAGPPATFSQAQVLGDDVTCEAYCPRAGKPLGERDPGYLDCPSIHAEVNALLQADRSAIEAGTFYVSAVPCFACAKAIANSGVHRCAWLTDAEAEGTGRDSDYIAGFFGYCRIVVNAVRPENPAVEIPGASPDENA